MSEATLLLTQSEVERLLDIRSCIDGVENAFRRKGEGQPCPGGILGVPVAGGGFHAKAAMLELSRPYFVVKTNANFPENPSTRGLPTIQGVLVLFDARNGPRLPPDGRGVFSGVPVGLAAYSSDSTAPSHTCPIDRIVSRDIQPPPASPCLSAGLARWRCQTAERIPLALVSSGPTRSITRRRCAEIE